MGKEYCITTIKKIYANDIKKRKDIEFCPNLNEAIKKVNFEEKDLEYVEIVGYIIPADGGCEDLYKEHYFLGKIVDKENLSEKEINSAHLKHLGFVIDEEIAGYVKAKSGRVYVFFKGDHIIELEKENEKSLASC